MTSIPENGPADPHLSTGTLEAVVDECVLGHKFAKLPDHPMRDDQPRCPHCMAMGLDKARKTNDAQLQAILSFKGMGYDDFLLRVWERAARAGDGNIWMEVELEDEEDS